MVKKRVGLTRLPERRAICERSSSFARRRSRTRGLPLYRLWQFCGFESEPFWPREGKSLDNGEKVLDEEAVEHSL